MTADTPIPIPAPPDLTIPEVAAEIRANEKFVGRLIKRGDLEAVRYGARFTRITRAALDAWKAAHSTLLDEQTRARLEADAAAAPAFTGEQEDTIRAAGWAPPPKLPRAPYIPQSRKRGR